MRFSTIFLAAVTACSLTAATECSDSEARELLAWKSAASKHRNILAPDVYTLEELETKGGYSYLVYFNTRPEQKYAKSVLVLMDEKCNIVDVDDTPRESRIILKPRKQ